MENLSDQSKVWIYQAERSLEPDETALAESKLSEFCSRWTAHNNRLKASFALPYGRFIVLAVDESQSEASGCSIDKSVHFLKDLSSALGVGLFGRLDMAYLEGNHVATLPYQRLPDAYREGLIGDETLFFDPRVSTLGEFRNRFIRPLRDHWLKSGL